MSEDAEMVEGLYPMRVVTRLTGLSPHTIRIWERRYGAVQPDRSGGNTRRFSAADVRRLTLLKNATEQGFRINEVARLQDDELNKRFASESGAMAPSGLGEDEPLPGRFTAIRQSYLEAVSRFETGRASELLNRAASLLAPRDFVFQVVLPLLRDAGDRWHRGQFTVAHEHLVTVQVRGLLDTLTRMIMVQPGARRVLVTTPEGHLHEFGALVGAMLAAARGLDPVYLGPAVPLNDVIHALEHSRADLVLLGVLWAPLGAELNKLKSSLRKLKDHAEVWVGLPADHPVLDSVHGIRWFTGFEELDVALTGKAARTAPR